MGPIEKEVEVTPEPMLLLSISLSIAEIVVRVKLKQIVSPSILWQGDQICCMKTARTLQCKICMTERKEILHRFRSDKTKIMNDNSDIYSSCKCKGRFNKFGRNLHIDTLRTRSLQKKVTSTRASKPKRNRFSFNLLLPRLCHPTSEEAPVTPEPASPQEVTPVF
jgi:hypothetical protein